MAAQMSGLEPGGSHTCPHATAFSLFSEISVLIHSVAALTSPRVGSELGLGTQTGGHIVFASLASNTTDALFSPQRLRHFHVTLIPATTAARDTCVWMVAAAGTAGPAPLKEGLMAGEKEAALVGCARKPDGSCVPADSFTSAPSHSLARETAVRGQPSPGLEHAVPLLGLSILSEQEAVFLKPAV